jgi:predicted acyl esterase
MGDGVRFFGPPLERETEITGPLSAKLFVSSSNVDADLFVIFGVFDPNGDEVTFQGAIDPHTPIAQGWLRASHRKLDPELSKEWRPYHPHQKIEPLTPGEIYELDIEIWPTSIVVPAGHSLGLSVLGRDYEWAGDTAGLTLSNFKNELRGCGPFLHDDPRSRPPEVFDNEVTLHSGPDHQNWVMLPIIP